MTLKFDDINDTNLLFRNPKKRTFELLFSFTGRSMEWSTLDTWSYAISSSRLKIAYCATTICFLMLN